MTRWPISRILLALVLGVGVAAAGGLGLFGKKGDPAPVDEAPAPPAEAAPHAPTAPPLFPDGLPVAVQQTPDGLANLSAQGCNACHVQAHDAWAGTAHATAWQDPHFQAALDGVGGSTACLSCHLPLTNQHPRLAAGYVAGDLARPDLQPNTQWDAGLMSEGVTCAACHVRDGQVLGPRAVSSAPHPVAVSTELSTSAFCASCHQLTWPGADQPFYDTFGEWERSGYAAAGVRCQDCHMAPVAGVAAASSRVVQASHAFATDSARAVSILVDLPAPEFQRGQDYRLQITVQNTGAGHSFPTGSPFKSYRLSVELTGADGKALAPAFTQDIGRRVEDAPPWRTLADNRIVAGGALQVTPVLQVDQKHKAQRATLRVSLLPVREGAIGEAVVVRSIPVPVL